MNNLELKICVLPAAADLPLPEYMSSGASGLDLRACISEPMTIPPGRRELIPTGLQIAVPLGFEGQVRPRSGLAYREGVTVLNTPGTIDADYRGEIKVVVINLGQDNYVVNRGDRIAQLVICPVVWAKLELVDELPASERGEGGFGHTGRS